MRVLMPWQMSVDRMEEVTDMIATTRFINRLASKGGWLVIGLRDATTGNYLQTLEGLNRAVSFSPLRLESCHIFWDFEVEANFTVQSWSLDRM